MTITGLSGDIGSGKSWKMLAYGLEQANFKQKFLVTNFALNLDNLKLYCAAKKQWWNVWAIEHGYLTVVAFCTADDSKQNLSLVPFFKDRENSICLLDEAGIFLNARNFKNTPSQLLMDLAQSRKAGNDLIWAAQFDTQVDLQFRNLTQFWIHCDGWTAYDKKMRRPALKWRTYFHFKGAEYQRWQASGKARTSFIRTYFAYSFKTEFGALSKKDIMLFSAFDSFTRLEKQQANAREINYKKLATEQDLLASGYYRRNYELSLRAAVKSGRGRFKSPEEKAATLAAEKKEAALAKYDFSKVQPLISYQAPDQEKLERLRLGRLLAPAFLFISSLILFFTLYQIADYQFSEGSQRREPLAGGAAARTQ